jgi:hypothetical protein
VEQWAVSHPLIVVPTVHRIDHADANPYIPRSYERPSVGTNALPTVHRMIYPAYPKSVCMCRCAVQSIFLSAFWPGLTAPALPASDPPSANWRTKMRKTWVFLEDFDPLRHISCLAEGGVLCIMCYTGRIFWPSANDLPWRKGVRVPFLFDLDFPLCVLAALRETSN